MLHRIAIRLNDYMADVHMEDWLENGYTTATACRALTHNPQDVVDSLLEDIEEMDGDPEMADYVTEAEILVTSILELD